MNTIKNRSIKVVDVFLYVVFALLISVIIVGSIFMALESSKNNKIRQAFRKKNEINACKKAGLRDPVWIRCGKDEQYFYCADDVGRLTLVKEPKCNTRTDAGKLCEEGN